jgi:hypothetical protein
MLLARPIADGSPGCRWRETRRSPHPSAKCPRANPGPTLQESVHKRRVEPDRLPKGAPNVLIVLIDDAGFGVPDTFGGFAHTPTLSRLRRRRHQLQPLSHHLDLFAHPRRVAHRAQSPARRQRHHRRARGGLGRLHRSHAEDFGDHRRSSERTTATRPPPSANGTTHPPTRPRRWGRSPTGPPVTASNTSTASWRAKPRSGNRASSKTPPPSSRRTTRSIISPKTWRTRGSPG